MRRTILTLLLLSVFIYVHAQVSVVNRSSLLSMQYLQIREDANFGLVFRGPGVNYGMAWGITNEKRSITYEYELGVGVLFARQIPALGFYLKPVDAAYLFKLPGSDMDFFLGPAFKIEYNYNLYPDLQSGFDYWFTNISMGVNAVYDFKYRTSSFHFKFTSSVAGFVSRQQDYRDPYFYDLGLKYALNHLHNDLIFCSFKRFNTSSLELVWRPGEDSRVALGYVIKYSGYYKQPGINIINHCIKLIINKKNK